tara:strand:- start:1240 stop:1542 length:303 start_codon:yes stop_codon:yes gene_type:complete
MTIHLVAFRQHKGGGTTEVWFADKGTAQVFHDDLCGAITDIKLDEVPVPVNNRVALATWLNNRYTYPSVLVSLDNKVLEAHINAKTVHLLNCQNKRQTTK